MTYPEGKKTERNPLTPRDDGERQERNGPARRRRELVEKNLTDEQVERIELGEITDRNPKSGEKNVFVYDY